MTWLNMAEQRDAEGNLTDLALALNAISDVGCDCGTDEVGSCVGCLCEQALKGLWEQLESVKAEVERLKAEAEHLRFPLAEEVWKKIADKEEQLRAHTWQQERAAVVKWLTGTIARNCAEFSREINILKPGVVIDQLARAIERGKHWPEGGTP